MAVSVLLWKLWKWVLYISTGTCELYRLACSNLSVKEKTVAIEKSLRLSKYKELNDICSGKHDVDKSLGLIRRLKKIPTDEHFENQIQPSLQRIIGMRTLMNEVDALRASAYSQDNPAHETILLELWALLVPSMPLEGRITKQWQYIGFQDKNPATDFRGMGLLGLRCLHHFAKHHNSLAQSVLLHSHHPKYGYPLAIVSIDLTNLLYGWLMSAVIHGYLYTAITQWPVTVNEFMEMHSYLVIKFDKFWISKEPENVMSFNVVRAEFAHQLYQAMIDGHINILTCEDSSQN